MIELAALSKIFYQKNTQVKAVDSVSLKVSQGEICVFLGPSGCGKTTTLKMINRLIHPSSGKVFINGEDTSEIDEVQLRRRIGYVIQQIGLFPNMTIEENITVVPKLLGWEPQKMKQRARELMAMVALDPGKFLGRYPREMSGGQQQRIGVIRALAADSPILLMDEPFGAVDPVNRESIQNEFYQMQRQLGKTVIMVSHDIDEAIKLADKVAIFRAGQLVQFSHPDALLAHPKDDFIANFVGQDRTLKRLLLVTAGDAAVFASVVKVNSSRDEALKILDENDLKFLTVTSLEGEVVGYVTRRLIKESPESLCGSIMKEFKVMARESEHLRILLSRMYEFNMSWLPVIDSAGCYLGEVTQDSIADYLSSGKSRYGV